MSHDRLLARNVLLNFLGQIVPLVAALVAIPLLVRTLGAPRFGILTLVWAAIGYFGLFDFGIGRALTHAIAIRVGAGDTEELAAVTWTALALMLAFGAVGGVILAATTGPLVGRWLNVPPALNGEARSAFYLMALSLPFSLLSTGFRGVMEAFQDFRTSTALRIPIGILLYVAPAAMLPFSHALGPVVSTLCALRIIGCLLHLIFCLRLYPYMRRDPALRFRLVGPLLRYGGWMTVSNIVSPIMVNMDRFVIGALLPMAAVAYYVTPYELVTKLFLIPAAILGVLFPALATVFSSDRTRAVSLVDRCVRVILIALFPATLVMVLLAHEGLTFWVGAVYAKEGTAILQILAIGVLINCAAGQVAYTALQSLGRPDLTARVHLVELPLYLGAMWLFVHWWGLVGVAMVWTLRVTADAAVLFTLMVRNIHETRPAAFAAARMLGVMTVALVAAALLPSTTARLLALAVSGVAFAFIAWKLLLEPVERLAIREFVTGGWRLAAVLPNEAAED
ncbi:MAG TPA: flippase [Gemmatimonadaceae bacterium]|jgi:O-antigen/teichoic acid export membrane protein